MEFKWFAKKFDLQKRATQHLYALEVDKHALCERMDYDEETFEERTDAKQCRECQRIMGRICRYLKEFIVVR